MVVVVDEVETNHKTPHDNRQRFNSLLYILVYVEQCPGVSTNAYDVEAFKMLHLTQSLFQIGSEAGSHVGAINRNVGHDS